MQPRTLPAETRPASRPRNKPPSLKTALFVLIIVLSNSFGNVLLGRAMPHLPPFSASFGYFVALITNAWLVSGTFLMAIFTMAQLSLFSWADLSFVLPVTASGYIITDILSHFLLGESISKLRWVGIIVLSLGVLLVAETPPHEKLEDEP